MGAFALLPGGAARPDTASADISSVTLDGVALTDGGSAQVVNEDELSLVITLASPRPSAVEASFSGVAGTSSVSLNFEDCTDNSAPAADDCEVDSGDGTEDIVVSDPTASGTSGLQTVTLTVVFECESSDPMVLSISETDGGGDELTATITCGPPTTPTTGPAATVVAQASPSTVNCNGTSIVTIQVRSAGGQPVAIGTAVTISASIGSVSPSSGQTTSADGSVFVFYTAPSNVGGAATITARAGNAQGTATVQVNCAAAATATTAPPPPTVAPGVISPPNTGEAGIASEHTDWTPFAAVAVIVVTLVGGAVAAVKTRE